MPPRRKAAAPFDGFVLALSGKFDSLGHTHSSLEALVKELGGSVNRSVTKNTTHIICTENDFEDDAKKVVDGKAKDLRIVKPDWLLDSSEQKKKLNEEDYTWTAPAPAPKAATTANKKRPIAVAKSDADAEDEPQTKKARATRGKGKAAVKAEPESEEDEETKPKQTKPAAKTGKATKATKANGKAVAKAEPEPEDAADEKVIAEGQFIKRKDVTIPLDENCPHTHCTVFVDPDSGMIYDASLNQSNSSNNNNKFYRIQIIHDSGTKRYRTWTRWGRVGEMGQNALLGNGSLDDAIKHFEKKFKDKSGLQWANRGDNPKPSKYAFVERSYNPDSSDDEDEDVVKTEKKDEPETHGPECTLEKPVKELMELIFNQQYFQATMSALNYDAQKLPLGKLSKATITRGFQQLKDLAALMDDQSLAQSKWNMTYVNATEHLSNTYYSVIPHAFGRNRPPVIRDDGMLKKEIELLESLSDMKDAADIMKIDRKSKHTVHPLDQQFQGLGLQEITTLDPDSKEFNLLEKYLNGSRGATHNVSYKVQQIFRIERNGEKDRFDKSEYAKIKSDRRLLWHGSRCTNFGGILSQGLRIAPPEAPVSGYMFGKGIYLADMSSKSAGYCASYISNGHALLLLCEAELGDPMQKLSNASYTAGEDAKKQGMHSTLGMGRTGPSKWMDAGVVHESLKGIKMPDTETKPGPTEFNGVGLFYNEYIAYDVAQVRLRYLLRVKM